MLPELTNGQKQKKNTLDTFTTTNKQEMKWN